MSRNTEQSQSTEHTDTRAHTLPSTLAPLSTSELVVDELQTLASPSWARRLSEQTLSMDITERDPCTHSKETQLLMAHIGAAQMGESRISNEVSTLSAALVPLLRR